MGVHLKETKALVSARFPEHRKQEIRQERHRREAIEKTYIKKYTLLYVYDIIVYIQAMVSAL